MILRRSFALLEANFLVPFEYLDELNGKRIEFDELGMRLLSDSSQNQVK